MTTAKPRRAGRRFLGCVVVPVACAAIAFGLMPELVFRISFGRGPLRADPAAVIEGLTPDEVIAILGPPHRLEDHDGETVWVYYRDAFAVNSIGVKYKKTGVVRHWWIR